MKGSLLLLCLLPFSLGLDGLDLSAYTDQFDCISKAKYDFVIINGYQSFGTVNPNVVANVQNAVAAGIKTVDVYMTPCVPCGNPAAQAQELISELGALATGRRVWLDIEIFQWTKNVATNQTFITALASAFTAAGLKVGVYTSYADWEAIVGTNWQGMNSYPLWYANYDNDQNYKDFVVFGGWKGPSIKQFNGSATECGVPVALDWSESLPSQ